MTSIIEVTAAMLEKEDRILIARRKPGKHLAGYWEFPGGKIEGAESPEDCLIREIKEEFSIDIIINQFIGESIYQYPEKIIKLMAYTGQIAEGEIVLRDHDKFVWKPINEILKFKLAPADIPLVELYQNKITRK